MNGFVRLHHPPKRILRYTDGLNYTARGNYLFEQSYQRYKHRPDAFDGSGLINGIIGRIDNFRIIES
jgi:hypothetical protein